MKQLFKLGLIATLLVPAVIAFSQETIAPAGNYFENAQGSISWTIGEPVIMTHVHAQYQITQGFQQSFHWPFTSIGDHLSWDAIVAYPNPTRNVVYISTSQRNPELMRYEIIDMRGNLVLNDRITDIETKVEMLHLHPGSYFIRVIRDPFLLKTINIIKY